MPHASPKPLLGRPPLAGALATQHRRRRHVFLPMTTAPGPLFISLLALCVHSATFCHVCLSKHRLASLKQEGRAWQVCPWPCPLPRPISSKLGAEMPGRPRGLLRSHHLPPRGKAFRRSTVDALSLAGGLSDVGVHGRHSGICRPVSLQPCCDVLGVRPPPWAPEVLPSPLHHCVPHLEPLSPGSVPKHPT